MLNLKKLKLNKAFFQHFIFCSIFSICCLHLIIKSSAKNITYNTEYKTITGLPHIIDGDSIRVNNLEMRLLGIDAPELFQICGDNSQNKYFCGKKAKEYLINLIGNNPITCKYRKFDKYHRALALCFLNNNLLNQTMVKNGWAVSYYSFKREERQARKQKLGIWQSKFEKPQKWRKEHHRNSRPLANPHII